MALIKRHVWSISAALCSAAIASLVIFYSDSDLVLKYIASALDAFAGFKAWLTPFILFLLMNGVVLSLAFTSGFLKQRQHADYGEDPEDLVKLVRREHRNCAEEEAGTDDEEDAESRRKDEEEDDGFYPEVLSSFFGDGTTTTRRERVLQRSASAPSATRAARSIFPSFSNTSSQKLGFNPSVISTTNPTTSSYPVRKVLRPAHTIPKPKSELTEPFARIQNVHGNADDKDVDQKADAFIGDFYKNLKLQRVDPNMERLERSYGR